LKEDRTPRRGAFIGHKVV